MDDLGEETRKSFQGAAYPADDNLRNSSEGTEPFVLEEEFKGKDAWQELTPEFLDRAPGGFSSALSFFSPEAFRFYLPAYLPADLSQELKSTDVTYYLTHGLTDPTRDLKVDPRR